MGFRQVNYHDFEYGGRESHELMTNRLKKPLEPITQLDIDVKNGLKGPRYDYAAFRRDLATAQVKEIEPTVVTGAKPSLGLRILRVNGDILATADTWNEAYSLRQSLEERLGERLAIRLE